MSDKDNRTELYCKYNVYKIDDGMPVKDCFVLRPDRDPAARAALAAYAIATTNKALAKDLMDWLIASKMEGMKND